VSVAAATAPLAFAPPLPSSEAEPLVTPEHLPGTERINGSSIESLDEPDEQPWHIVREKEHPGEPMTVDDALFHMELLGHDFYLFNDKDSGRPSVVYRRRAYDYGVICLGI
jgi:hypothetical protein